VQSGEDIDAFMEATGPAVKLLLDTGHATFGGADPVALAKKYRTRIAHVHCKDVRKDVLATAREKDWSFLDAVVEGCFTVPGDGMVNYPAFFKELPGYSGWLVVEAEQDPEKANPLKYAKLGCANLRRYAKDAKLA
jgi:inosose dehydratase